ncbi:hypothetical protein VR46_34560, partial [Streptomyces sp. NRRL S-444]
FVCDRYARAGRLADAVTVRRDALRARPSLAAYRHLRTAARTAGTWEGIERAAALEALRAYERMTELLLSARACHRVLGTESAFAAYLAALRADQKRKRKLMAMLDRHGL